MQKNTEEVLKMKDKSEGKAAAKAVARSSVAAPSIF